MVLKYASDSASVMLTVYLNFMDKGTKQNKYFGTLLFLSNQHIELNNIFILPFKNTLINLRRKSIT